MTMQSEDDRGINEAFQEAVATWGKERRTGRGRF